MKKYIVQLTCKEREELKKMVSKNRIAASKRLRAQIILAIDQGINGPAMTDAQVAKAFDCTARTPERLRKKVVEKGIDQTVEHGNTGSYRARKLDGKAEAYLIATACSKAPDGYSRWTVRLLAEKLVELDIVDSCSKDTVHRTLKKTNLSLT